MAIRTAIGNTLISFGRKLARADGRELAVDLSNHSIDIKMVRPDTEERAWDETLYRYGNVFIDGYANPIKPIVRSHKSLDEPDEVDVEVGDETDTHVKMMASKRYSDYMRQDLVSQLLNPKERWRLLAYGILGLGLMQFIMMVVIVWATGGF